jgi:glycine/serine hydroxymethyltransferase
MKEEEMIEIARIFDEAISNRNNDEKLNELRKDVLKLCKAFPVYK